MSKIPSIKPKKILQVLLRNGFYIHHQVGSHIVLKSSKDPIARVTIPIHNRDLKKKTLLSILKQAGLDKSILTQRK